MAGSPAFTAPEVLDGDPPTAASDVYGLGSTLFCALTGHAAFERREGEQVLAQFARITSQPVPDLGERGFPADLAAVVQAAMHQDPHDRPSAVGLGEALQRVQQQHGYQVSDMALLGSGIPGHGPLERTPSARVWRPPPAETNRRGAGGFPLELTSFVGRRSETSEIKNLLSDSRLVTLAGIGGVGKTRLALRAASNARRNFADGDWVVDLGDMRNSALLIEVVAAALGVQEDSARPMPDIIVEFLSPKEALLVLDNGEQVVDALARLAERLLMECPSLHILVTSREPLDIAGEAVLRVSPLAVPGPPAETPLQSLRKYDAVTLFTDRAAASVPGFEVTEENKAAVIGICSRLDGLPLAIELAAARMRTMSPAQILERLTDRYALLTRGSRTAPHRQQTLRWCIDWSYQLCGRKGEF